MPRGRNGDEKDRGNNAKKNETYYKENNLHGNLPYCFLFLPFDHTKKGFIISSKIIHLKPIRPSSVWLTERLQQATPLRCSWRYDDG
jgi:hypothetical protein